MRKCRTSATVEFSKFHFDFSFLAEIPEPRLRSVGEGERAREKIECVIINVIKYKLPSEL